MYIYIERDSVYKRYIYIIIYNYIYLHIYSLYIYVQKQHVTILEQRNSRVTSGAAAAAAASALGGSQEAGQWPRRTTNG
jgi:ABC-type uncharacterized transport system substrate-binding protein